MNLHLNEIEKNRAYCILPCCHTFCDECISKLIDPNRHCPSCRSQITETKGKNLDPLRT